MRVLFPKIGFVTNPFYRGVVRNKLCACLSGEKVKKCCGKEPYIDGEVLDKLIKSMVEREAK